MNENQEEISRKVESGEYFREARNIYASNYTDPMSERYLYLIITGLSLAVLFVAVTAMGILFPLVQPIPFTFVARDVLNDIPVMIHLAEQNEDANTALKRFLVSQYVQRREVYDIDQLELNVRTVKTQSTQEVFDGWQKQLDPANPESPIALFQRHTVRMIQVLRSRLLSDGTVEVEYEATMRGKLETDAANFRKSRWIANIAFSFRELTVDQKTGAVPPLEFMVTDYRTRRLQE